MFIDSTLNPRLNTATATLDSYANALETTAVSNAIPTLIYLRAAYSQDLSHRMSNEKPKIY